MCNCERSEATLTTTNGRVLPRGLRPLAMTLLIFFNSLASADVYIKITGANVKRAKLALGQLHPLPDAGQVNPALAKQVRAQVISDLEFANLFDFLSESTYAAYDNPRDLYNAKYDELSGLGASFMLKMGYKLEAGKLFMEAILYDVAGRKKVFGTRYQYPAAQFTRLVHAMSEDVLKELTGERGLFFSRVSMVCWSKRGRSPDKEVYIADSDGRNLLQLTNDRTVSLSPSWSPDGKFLTYAQFEYRVFAKGRQKRIVLKKHNLQNGDRKVLSAKEGMNSGATWMPNGKAIAATMSFTGRPEVYLIDPNNPAEPEPLSRNIQWRRMAGEGFQASQVSLLFEVEPSFSPDGSHMVISSRRTGHAMIYTVNMATKVATQLTFAGQYNATPAWSPKGDKILFAAQRTGEGNFDLYLIDPDGNNLARVTNGERPGRRVNSENPSWAPTGRHFVYASNEGGSYGVYIMTLDGQHRRKISPPDKECKTPNWGPAEG